MSLFNIRDIYDLDQDGTKSMVVKHFPTNIHEARLQSHFELICGVEELQLIWPHHGCDIAVAILDTELPDSVAMFQENIFSNPIKNHYPELTPLGSPAGVFIQNTRDCLHPDDITSHIKGIANVETIKQTSIANQQYLGINIPDLCAIHALLENECLTICDQVVTLQPYYPVICDYIVDKMVQNEDRASTESASYETPDETPKGKNTMCGGNLTIIFDTPMCQAEDTADCQSYDTPMCKFQDTQNCQADDTSICLSKVTEDVNDITEETFHTSTWSAKTNYDSDVEVKLDDSDKHFKEIVSNDSPDEETKIFPLPSCNTTKIATVKPFCIDRHSPVSIQKMSPTNDRKANGSKMSQAKEERTKKGEVILELSLARCFLSCFENKLRKEIVDSGGTLNVETLAKDPMKIRLNVEGNDHVVDSLKRTQNSIWHESLDLGKIASDEDEVWLLMKNLNRDIGEQFMYTFEKDNNCFIDMVKEGKFVITRPRVQVDSVDESSSETDTDDELNAHGAVGGIDYVDQDEDIFEDQHPTFDERPMIRSRHKHKHVQNKGQGRMNNGQSTDFVYKGKSALQDLYSILSHDSDEAALQKAIKLSMQDDIVHGKSHSWHSQKQQDKFVVTRKSHPSRKSRSEEVKGVTVQILKGKIVKQNADVLVNVVNGSSQNPFGTTVASSFLEVGGEELQHEYQANRGRTRGSTLVTTQPTGNLQCTTVFHVIIRKGSNCEQVVDKAMEEILNECERSRFGTVAIPPIGVGRMFRFQANVVAERMFSKIYDYFSGALNHLQDITIVIFDDPSYDIFDAAFTQAIRNNAGSYNKIQKPLTGFNSGQVSTQTQHHKRQSAGKGHRGRRSKDDHDDRKVPKVHSLPRISQLPNPNTRTSHPKRHISQASDQTPITKLKITVFAENKSECVKARDKLSMKIRKTFLHEERISRGQHLSKDAKARIARLLDKNDVKSSKDSKTGNYILKGYTEKVTKTKAAIYEEILNDKPTRKPKCNFKRHTHEYVHMMAIEEPEAPKYWNHYKEDTPVKELILTLFKSFVGSKHKKVKLETTTPEYREILKMINETFYPDKVGHGSDATGIPQGSYRSLHVLKIQRVENLELYEKFALRRKSLFRCLCRNKFQRYPLAKDIPNCKGPPVTCKYRDGVLGRDMHAEINEHLLFHGTKLDAVDVVCNNGFDQKVGTRSAMLGQGVYGAESSTKADQYTDPQSNRSFGPGNKKKMFLIRMLLGHSYVSFDSNPHKFMRPPCTKCQKDNCNDARHGKGKFGHFFDSVIGENGKLFREFVVYDGDLCYPEYLISYERH